MSQTLLYGVTITVEAALSAATGTYGAWDTAVWDSSTWGPDIVWSDITDYVRSITTSRSFDRAAQSWEPGTATLVLDNRDARFTAVNLAGPYVTGGITGIRPWRPIRVRATYNSVTYDVYRGYATSWDESYVDPIVNAGDAVVTVPCTDELGSLARFGGLAVPLIGAGELSGTRVQRILNNAGHTGTRAVDTGNFTMQATDVSRNAADELKLTADSEAGALYVARDGTVVFERNTALVENTRSMSIQATFGDGGGSELQIRDATPANDGDLLVNIAAYARVGGTVQTVTNPTSRALYGDKRDTRSDLMCQTDGQAASLAAFHVMKFSSPEYRIASVSVWPRDDPSNLFPAVLGREVHDLVRVVRRPPGGITITQDCHVVGISHVITPENWQTTFGLWSAAIYQTAGRWDSATWDTSSWFV